MTRATQRKKKSQAWVRAHHADPYVQQARQAGWRARAAFKLIEIDAKDHLLNPGMTVVDLGAAPGSWSQYARRRIQPGGMVIALDVLGCEPVAGVEFIQGDIRDAAVVSMLALALAGRQADVVLSDMSPNITGIAATDSAQTAFLVELALDFSRQHLKPGGNLLVKVFQGDGFMEIRSLLLAEFVSVLTRKPVASKNRSAEVYLLARKKRS